MYLRTIKGKTKTYLAIVAGERVDGKVKQKMLCNLGSVDELNQESMLELGNKLIQVFGGVGIKHATDVSESLRDNWGVSEVVSSLFSLFELDTLFERLYKSRRVQYDVISAIKLMLANRLCNPCSKLRMFQDQAYYAGINHVQLEHLYRSLDELHLHKDALLNQLFVKQKQLGGPQVDVVFFDVTTLYFESQKADDLKEFGYSKDCKFNEVQVVLSLIIDSDGRPLSYELFPGNSYEGHSLLPCLKQLKSQYQLNKVVIVADRGIGSFDNLQQIKQAGFDYIIGARLRTFSKSIQDTALDSQGYHTLTHSDEHTSKYKIIEHTRIKKQATGIDITEKTSLTLSEQLICFWSSKRAMKDKKDRSRLVEKANTLLTKCSLHGKRGARKYIKIKGEDSSLDQHKIDQDALWDGYYAISSNTDLSPQEIMDAYHTLWKIEESFRTLKGHFEARPMFHWTTKRISGHIMLNFIALVIEKHLEIALKARGSNVSHHGIREALLGMERSHVKMHGATLRVHAKLSDTQKFILEVLNINIPANAIDHA